MKMSRSLYAQCLILLFLPLVFCGPLSVQFRKHKAIYGEGPGTDAKGSSGPGEPLFLTPYIEKGEIDQGIYIHRDCNISYSVPRSPVLIARNLTQNSSFFSFSSRYFPHASNAPQPSPKIACLGEAVLTVVLLLHCLWMLNVNTCTSVTRYWCMQYFTHYQSGSFLCHIARELSRVPPIQGLESYAGILIHRTWALSRYRWSLWHLYMPDHSSITCRTWGAMHLTWQYCFVIVCTSVQIFSFLYKFKVWEQRIF